MKAATAGSTAPKIRCGGSVETLPASRFPSQAPSTAVAVNGAISARSSAVGGASRAASAVEFTVMTGRLVPATVGIGTVRT